MGCGREKWKGQGKQQDEEYIDQIPAATYLSTMLADIEGYQWQEPSSVSHRIY